MAVDRARLSGRLRQIAGGSSRRLEFPRRLCVACADELPVDGVGLTLTVRGRPDRTVLLGASDRLAERIEELQFNLGEGPSLAALLMGRPVLLPDIGTDGVAERWPIFAREATDAGIGSMFAFPLQIGNIVIGVLHCYRSRAGPLAEVADALAVSDVVTIVLLSTRWAEDGVAELFDVSWRNHAVVHQATGALSAQLGISLAEALVRLRAQAFHRGQALDLVAADVLAGRLHLTQ